MSSDDTRDTVPSPPLGVDPELVEAFAADIATLSDSAEGMADQLRGLVASMRRQAAEARTGKETGR
jgi:hypothetical protein